jgi:hypothetical protein
MTIKKFETILTDLNTFKNDLLCLKIEITGDNLKSAQTLTYF